MYLPMSFDRLVSGKYKGKPERKPLNYESKQDFHIKLHFLCLNSDNRDCANDLQK